MIYFQKLANLTHIQNALELLSLPQGAAPKSLDEAKKKKYQFWETQPVPKFGELNFIFLIAFNFILSIGTTILLCLIDFFIAWSAIFVY